MSRRSVDTDRSATFSLSSAHKITPPQTMSSSSSVSMTSSHDRVVTLHKKVSDILKDLLNDATNDVHLVFEKTVDLGKLLHSLFVLLRANTPAGESDAPVPKKEQEACRCLANLVNWTDKVVLCCKSQPGQSVKMYVRPLTEIIRDLVKLNSGVSPVPVPPRNVARADSTEDYDDDQDITPYKIFSPVNARPRSESEEIFGRMEPLDGNRPKSLPDSSRFNVRNAALGRLGMVGSVGDLGGLHGVRQRVPRNVLDSPQSSSPSLSQSLSNSSDSLLGTSVQSDSGEISPLQQAYAQPRMADMPPPVPEKKKNRSGQEVAPPPVPAKAKTKLHLTQSLTNSGDVCNLSHNIVQRAHSLDDPLEVALRGASDYSILNHALNYRDSESGPGTPGSTDSGTITDGQSRPALPPRPGRVPLDDQPPPVVPPRSQLGQASPPVPQRPLAVSKSTPIKRQGMIHEKGIPAQAVSPYSISGAAHQGNESFFPSSLSSLSEGSPASFTPPTSFPLSNARQYKEIGPGGEWQLSSPGHNGRTNFSYVGGDSPLKQRQDLPSPEGHDAEQGPPPLPRRPSSQTPPLSHRPSSKTPPLSQQSSDNDLFNHSTGPYMFPKKQSVPQSSTLVNEPPALPKKMRDIVAQPIQMMFQDVKPRHNDDDPKPPPVPQKRRTMLEYLTKFSDKWEDPGEQIYGPLIFPHIRSATVSTPGDYSRPKSSVMIESKALANKLADEDSRLRSISVSGKELDLPPPRPAKKRQSYAPLKQSRLVGNDKPIQGEPALIGSTDERPYSIYSSAELKESLIGERPLVGGNAAEDDKSDSLSVSSKMSDISGESSNPLVCANVEYFLLFNEEDSGEHSLRGGGIDALVAYAASGRTLNNHEADRLYGEAFLLTYRTFISPHDLFAKLVERHGAFLADKDSSIRHHTISLLITVLNELRRPRPGLNELDEEVLNLLTEKVYQLVSSGDLKLAMLLRQNIYKKVHLAQMSEQSPTEFLRSTAHGAATELSLTKFKASHLAQQMAQLDALFFKEVEVHEILEWSMHQSEEKCYNLSAFTEHFNNVSNWCRTRVLESDKESEREKVAKTFIKVMNHLRKMNDFSSLLAILSAMDCASVSRLPWPKSHQQAMDEHRKLIDSTMSFKYYRDALAEGMKNPPCIPYLGLFLQDLTFLNIGNPNFLDEKKTEVNFMKRWRQFTLLNLVRNCQLSYYDFKWDESILSMFGGFQNHLNEEALYQRSLQIKPRGS